MNKVLGRAVSKKKSRNVQILLKKIKKWPEENVKCQASERATSVKRGPSGPTPPTGHWHLHLHFAFWLPRLESSSPSGRHGLTQRLSDTLAASPRLRSLCLALAEAETISDPALASIAALVHRLLPAG